MQGDDHLAVGSTLADLGKLFRVKFAEQGTDLFSVARPSSFDDLMFINISC